MGIHMQPPSHLERSQAVHDACFESAQTDHERNPLTIANWVDNRVPGGVLWDVICEDAESWRHTCVVRFGELHFDVERLVMLYDAG
jgi:hypothetical protein